MRKAVGVVLVCGAVALMGRGVIAQTEAKSAPTPSATQTTADAQPVQPLPAAQLMAVGAGAGGQGTQEHSGDVPCVVVRLVQKTRRRDGQAGVQETVRGQLCDCAARCQRERLEERRWRIRARIR